MKRAVQPYNFPVLKVSGTDVVVALGGPPPHLQTLSHARSIKRQIELARGMGGKVLFDRPVSLEPPYVPFDADDLSPYDLYLLGSGTGFEPSPLKKMFAGGRQPSATLQPEYVATGGDVKIVRLFMSSKEADTRDAFKQVLSTLNGMSAAVSFEVIGTAETVRCQMAGQERDLSRVAEQLYAAYPESEFEEPPMANTAVDLVWERLSIGGVVREYVLADTHFFPLAIPSSRHADPLNALIAALSDLGDGEFGLLQVQFIPARHLWHRNILAVAGDFAETRELGPNDPDVSALAKQKTCCPMFAVAVSIAGSSSEIVHKLEAFIHQFDSGLNRFKHLGHECLYDPGVLADALSKRMSLRWGMLLDAEELAAIVHPPSASVTCEKLERRRVSTRPAPLISQSGRLSLGENVHRGKRCTVRVPDDRRTYHMYVIGATGSGKTTLLQNMILQDIEAGAGVGVLDPYGGLVHQKLIPYIPASRYDDVVLFDPADDEYPVAFNFLSAETETERSVLADAVVSIFKRELGSSWGPQMETVLANLVRAYAESSQGGSLRDARRFLADEEYRALFLETVGDEDVVFYWRRVFPELVGKAASPVLTRLDRFLQPKPIRYLVGQRENKLRFREIMDTGKIFLCPVSHGAITADNALLLGSLITAKFQQASMSRHNVDESKRRPFYLYIDEFQNFVTRSMEQILSGARQYGLGLILAHQVMEQVAQQNEMVMKAARTNPFVRVCFRVDSDARVLADGFAHFGEQDLMNLGVGEAIVRMERADWDFNIRTSRPPAPPPEAVARKRGGDIRELSRAKYATPRAEVERQWREGTTSHWQDPKDDADFYRPK